jgi:hypothetical protein
LESLPPKPPNEVQTNPEENGLSCGVITLSALLIESAITRTRYRRSEISKDDQAKYFEKVTSNTELAKDIDEVIAVRDAIVHNHLWEADVDWHPQTFQLIFKSPPILVKGFGNQRRRRVTDEKTRQSRRLKLNLFPLRIWRADAYASLRVVAKSLEALETVDPNYFSITTQYFTFHAHSHLYTLRQITDLLPESFPQE